MRAYERLIRYVGFETVSDEESTTTPSTPGQWDLARHLAKELETLGLEEVYVDDHAYVYGKIPATPGLEGRRCVGFIAHLDTVSIGKNGPVRPQIIPDYDGGPVALGESGLTLSPEMFPHLPALAGQTLITTDGTTVLGADDKAGVAEIVTLCEVLVQGGRPHGPVSVCFTPDEEIGHGAALLDLGRFGAQAAYTADGSAVEEVEVETFNAAAAHWTITGVAVHPGDAKGVMVNAAAVAAEIEGMIPQEERPRYTAGYQGFYHLTGLSGDVSGARMDYIIRDHDAQRFAQRKAFMASLAHRINEKYGPGTAAVTVTDQYRNMAQVIALHPELVEIADAAIRAVGLEPVSHPVRGGTDGAQLSFRGLPCPNLGTGGYGYHGPYEHITAEAMDKAVAVFCGIVDAFAGL